jgi:hypothetical protein
MNMVRTRFFQRRATLANIDLKRFCSKRLEYQVLHACAMARFVQWRVTFANMYLNRFCSTWLDFQLFHACAITCVVARD